MIHTYDTSSLDYLPEGSRVRYTDDGQFAKVWGGVQLGQGQNLLIDDNGFNGVGAKQNVVDTIYVGKGANLTIGLLLI